MTFAEAVTEVNGITLPQPNTHGGPAQAVLERAQQIEMAELAKRHEEQRRLLAQTAANEGGRQNRTPRSTTATHAGDADLTASRYDASLDFVMSSPANLPPEQEAAGIKALLTLVKIIRPTETTSGNKSSTSSPNHV